MNSLAFSLGLTHEQFQTVVHILSTRLSHTEIWVFGSRATGRFKKTSDLDLCLCASIPLSLGLLSDLKDDFADSDLPFRVDLIEFSTLEGVFKENVIREKRFLTACS